MFGFGKKKKKRSIPYGVPNDEIIFVGVSLDDVLEMEQKYLRLKTVGRRNEKIMS